MTAIRSPAGQACWRTSYGSFEASESWGWWTNILNLNLADLEQTPPSPMQAKRARRVPRAADARHDHFDLDANDATAESDFGETAHQQRPRLGVPGARSAPAHFPLVPSAGPLGPLGHPDQWRLPSHISPPISTCESELRPSTRSGDTQTRAIRGKR